MSYQEICQRQGHDGENTIGFCFHQDCIKNSEYCVECLYDCQKPHQAQCLRFKQIQKHLEDRKQQLEQILQNIKNLLEEFLEVIKEFQQNYLQKIEEFIQMFKSKQFEEIKSNFKELSQLINRNYNNGNLNDYTLKIEYTSKNLIELVKKETGGEKIQSKILSNNDPEQNQSQKPSRIIIQEQVLKPNQQADPVDDSLKYYNIEIAQTLVNQSQEFFQSGSYAQAQKLLEESLHYDSENFEAYFWLSKIVFKQGKSLFEQRKNSEALTQIEKCISLNKKFGQAYYFKGIVLHELGRLEEALNTLKALEEIPGGVNALIYFRIAQVLLDLKRYEDSIKYCDQALLFDEKLYHAYNWKALALEKLSRFQEALQNIEKALQQQPRNLNFLYNKGGFLSHMQRDEEALATLNKAIEFNRNDPKIITLQIHQKKLNLLIVLKRFEEAIECANEWITLQPQEEKAYEQKVKILFLLGRKQEAQEIQELIQNKLIF